MLFKWHNTIVATMTVPPYFISTLYLIKISLKPQTYPAQERRVSSLITGFLAAFYVLIMGLAGLKYITIAFIVYMLGIPLFIKARKEQASNEPIFTKIEKYFVGTIIIIAVGYLILLIKK